MFASSESKDLNPKDPAFRIEIRCKSLGVHSHRNLSFIRTSFADTSYDCDLYNLQLAAFSKLLTLRASIRVMYRV